MRNRRGFNDIKNSKKIVNIKNNYYIKKQDKKMVKKHKDWQKLDKTEKGICYGDDAFLKIMKNVYFNYKNCSKKDFVSDYYFQTKLLPKLNWINNRNLGFINGNSYFSDKNYQQIFLKFLKMPKTIVRKINGELYDENFNIISKEQAMSLMNDYDCLVYKVSIGSSHGRGEKLINKGEYERELNDFGNNLVIQEKIEQSSFLSSFNKSSVNILRVTSILIKNEVHILSCILRVGAPGAFCDHLGYKNNNPRIIGINKEGFLYGNAIDPDDCIAYDNVFGKKIEGKIPNFEKICDLVKKEHIRFAHTRIIGWDLTLNNKDEIICIEFNSTYPGIVQSQMVCGPIFGRILDNNKKVIEMLN